MSFKEEWNAIERTMFANFVNSIPRRVATVITNDEGRTKY